MATYIFTIKRHPSIANCAGMRVKYLPLGKLRLYIDQPESPVFGMQH